MQRTGKFFEIRDFRGVVDDILFIGLVGLACGFAEGS